MMHFVCKMMSLTGRMLVPEAHAAIQVLVADVVADWRPKPAVFAVLADQLTCSIAHSIRSTSAVLALLWHVGGCCVCCRCQTASDGHSN